MDFHQLQYFVAIVESGSITAAAKKLFLSQPPLSMQMKQLEKELGCILFLRGAREIQLTEAGKLLYNRAKSLLELRRVTEEELAACADGTSGTIRLGMISSVGSSLLPQWLAVFHTKHPDIRFSVYEADTYQILEKLHQDRIEMALVRSPFSAEGIQRIPLRSESLIAVGHRSFFADATSISLQQLAEQPLIVYRRWENILNQKFRTLGITPSYFCVNEDARTTVYWADAGLGIGIIPQSACSLRHNPETIMVPIADAMPDTTIFMVRREQAYMAPHTLCFWEELQKICKEV
ncbi:MAG: LysR family transcriptional regulator [Oscillospiraceae bacterium]|nr:LysR family transcriptional regulator [Oscillospiraceae bacterium]MDD7295127.1 LysR family transcriptional regulator [Oscillospiraceae bacterium]MDY2510836.1 LysR family transcriptional regulator [Ruminococcus callidus]